MGLPYIGPPNMLFSNREVREQVDVCIIFFSLGTNGDKGKIGLVASLLPLMTSSDSLQF
jgi:hypothetical protein